MNSIASIAEGEHVAHILIHILVFQKWWHIHLCFNFITVDIQFSHLICSWNEDLPAEKEKRVEIKITKYPQIEIALSMSEAKRNGLEG